MDSNPSIIGIYTGLFTRPQSRCDFVVSWILSVSEPGVCAFESRFHRKKKMIYMGRRYTFYRYVGRSSGEDLYER